MLARLQKALKDKDQGFTLIELLVVIVIIGILAAIAVPLFLSQREKGVQAGIKSDLKALATAEETYYVDNAAYTTSGTAIADAGFRSSSGNTIHIDTNTAGNGYCIKGTNTGTSSTYWYDSTTGAITDAASKPTTDGCATATPVAFTA